MWLVVVRAFFVLAVANKIANTPRKRRPNNASALPNDKGARRREG
jgi:hypothetical protein